MNISYKIIWNVVLLLMGFMTITSSMVLGVRSALKGAYTQETLTSPSISEYVTGNYQANFDKLSQQNFRTHDWGIKAHNEWDYRIWNHLNASDVIEEKDGYLFEQVYIENLYNKNLLAQNERLEENKDAILLVDSLLKSKSKQLVFLLMPSKSFIYPDKIKDFKKENISPTHIHDSFLEFTKEKQIKVLNFLDYFQKTKLDYPSFPKQGIHLSQYAESIVLDSLLSFIEKETDLDVYDYEFSDLTISKEPRGRDNDIGQILNLLNPIPFTEDLAYRDFKLNRIDTINTPNVLVIADSFYWGLYPTIADLDLFGNHEFWFRYGQMFSKEITGKKFADPLTCLRSLDHFDYVFIMVVNTDVDFAGWNYFKRIKTEIIN